MWSFFDICMFFHQFNWWTMFCPNVSLNFINHFFSRMYDFGGYVEGLLSHLKSTHKNRLNTITNIKTGLGNIFREIVEILNGSINHEQTTKFSSNTTGNHHFQAFSVQVNFFRYMESRVAWAQYIKYELYGFKLIRKGFKVCLIQEISPGLFIEHFSIERQL